MTHLISIDCIAIQRTTYGPSVSHTLVSIATIRYSTFLFEKCRLKLFMSKDNKHYQYNIRSHRQHTLVLTRIIFSSVPTLCLTDNTHYQHKYRLHSLATHLGPFLTPIISPMLCTPHVLFPHLYSTTVVIGIACVIITSSFVKEPLYCGFAFGCVALSVPGD